MPAFFDKFPRFFETSETLPTPHRLAYRYDLIIEQNRDVLAGKRIVEIASHDGRWAFAAVKAGAKSVHGVEARQHLVDHANATFAHYGVPKAKYEFVCDDGFDDLDKLERAGRKFDTALVLGFLYHTAKPYDLIERMAKLDCSAIIVDTVILPNFKRPFVIFATEKTEREGNAVGRGPRQIVSTPSLPALKLMLKAAGFTPTVVSSAIGLPPQGCNDYKLRNRITIVGRR